MTKYLHFRKISAHNLFKGCGLLNSSANHIAFLQEVPSCSLLESNARAFLWNWLLNSPSPHTHSWGLCFISAQQNDHALSCRALPANWNPSVQVWKAGVMKRLLHFCTWLITLTFDHVLCSGRRGSWKHAAMLPSKQICICVAAQHWLLKKDFSIYWIISATAPAD